MNFSQQMIEQAKERQLRLVLPEGNDPRVLAAAQQIIELNMVSGLYILGNPDELTKKAEKNNISLKGIEIIDFIADPRLQVFTHQYYEQRKHKGLTEEQALLEMTDDVFFGAKLMESGMVDAMVSGSYSPTAKTLRASIFFGKPKVKTISGAMIMEVQNKSIGHNGRLIFGDCAVNPKPTAEQLADIAEGCVDTARTFLHVPPRVAMLSFSTLGSAKHEDVQVVADAVEILKKRNVDFEFDGEMQLDAAIDQETAALKAPNSPVAGKANVLVFPNLSAGNIGYKLVQRFSENAQAFGPILQGLTLPINDLSRGCSIEDIVATSAITLNQVRL